jgi:hypothetical protein
MSQTALKLSNKDAQLSLLLNKLDNTEFVMKFAEDPFIALEESGVNMSLSEFTSMLSEDKDFYELITNKLSKVIDVKNMDVPASSCCS